MRSSHFGVKPHPKTGTQFDLTGEDWSHVPTAYLAAIVRSNGKVEMARRAAEELERRGVVNYRTRRMASGTCSLCPRVGAYIVGKVLFCRKHKGAAMQSQGTQRRRAAHEETSQAIEGREAREDRRERISDKWRAFVKSRTQKA